jgi:protein SCO1/2
MPAKNLLIAVVIGIALAAGIVVALRHAPAADTPLAATVLPAAAALPPFRLVDDDGRDIGPEVFEGHWNLVFFGFTQCPDVCPLTLQMLSRARAALAEAGETPLPRIVLVSVDPERDTPERLGAYVDSFGSSTLGITGSLDEIRRLTAALGIYFAKVGENADTYTVDHSTAVLLIGPDGRYRAVFGGPHEVDDFVHDLPLVTGP